MSTGDVKDSRFVANTSGVRTGYPFSHVTSNQVLNYGRSVFGKVSAKRLILDELFFQWYDEDIFGERFCGCFLDHVT